MGYYDYYKNICICPPRPVILGLGDQYCNEVDSWPVDVYNVAGIVIGNATNKAEYINIWNSNSINRTVGRLFNFWGPFSFLLMVNPGQIIPYCLGGIGVPSIGLFAIEFATEFE
ncbi:hypothetical protein ACLOAU_14695 [Niabella sp. CJ426]|uniref:hypothetical protein n=1 Tax=Niabella sp. CJ426 TaxID=3393740 RepID=UPI003D084DFA